MTMKRHERILAGMAGALAAGVLLFSPAVNAKKVLGHEDFDQWRRARNYCISNDGEWAAYATVPQEGDADLFFYNTKTKKKIHIQRGYDPQFSADGRYAVALVKPHFADTRKAKIDKKKGLDLPQDSLAIITLKTGDIEMIPEVTGFKLGKKGGSWVAYKSVDTLYAKRKDIKEKGVGRPLVVRNLAGPERRIVKWVDNYVFSNDGQRLALTIKKAEKDSVATDGTGVINLPDTAFILIDRDKKFYGEPVFNEAGNRLAYTASNDSVDSGTKKAQLYLADLEGDLAEPEEIPIFQFTGDMTTNLMPGRTPEQEERRKELMKEIRGEQLFVNQYSQPKFSHDGRRLVIGVAPYIAPDDTTIVDFERADLDIWRWDAPYTPPQENKLVDKIRKKTYPVAIDLGSMKQTLIDHNPLATVYPGNRWDGEWAMVVDPSETAISKQWDYGALEKIYSVNVNDGSRRLAGEAAMDDYAFGPSGNVIVWYTDRHYFTFDNRTGEKRCISKDVPVELWDVDDDHPMPSPAYGIAGWGKDDAAILVYDKYDIWSLDPTGKTAPVCLTKGEGRKTNRTYRYLNTDKENRRYLTAGDEMLLDVFDHTTKEHGLAILKYGAPAVPALKTMEPASFYSIRQAEKAPVYSWMKASFDLAPDIWVSRGTDFAKAVKVSDSNPQQKDYSWGTAQLFKWYTFSGKPAEGVLYLPEDFDPNKEYPLMTVFYERGADDLYTHYTMEPSWSWVNYPFYVSRGYVVLVPDIFYTAGVPGEGAYDYVCSGVDELCKAYPNIDRKRVGIDGQSWGGYQTAYLVTRTNMFACAGSGAPVANMTSAFGGIRWGTGDSRQAQYEVGQSRIGRSLLEAPELYIANSPVFHADRVETPLLIMHNDEDGAVPWYQGIEMFMALRRLQKPVWMLQYNGEQHNIVDRKNRKDITVRLQQFFDHYLMGAPMPKWMKEGIPAVRKGQIMNYETTD